MKVLLMAGSGEARLLAEELVNAGHDVTASLAGVTRDAMRYGCQTRVGGFGGRDGFDAYLAEQNFDLVIDATHPFAARISARTYDSCKEFDLPFLQLVRPAWQAADGDNWKMIDTASAARGVIESGARVFLATGRQTLSEFDNLHDCHLICRQIDPPDGPFPFPNGEYLIGRPPFSVDDEIKLFDDLKIDVLVVKNAGGLASRSKLDAARALSIPVVMIRRPDALNAERVATVDAALAWVRSHADH